MNRMGFTWILVVLLVMAGCHPSEDAAFEEAPRPDGASELNERISLDFKDASLQEVFGLFRDILGSDVEIDPDWDERISIKFNNITIRTALNALCESGGCQWELVEGKPPVLRITTDGMQEIDPDDEPTLERIDKEKELEPIDILDRSVNLDLVDARAPVVLQLIARTLGAELDLDESLTDEKISIVSPDESLRAVLEQICNDLDCEWKLLAADELRPMLLVAKQSEEENR